MALPKISTHNRGFSLIEILIVIGLFAMIAGVTLIVSMDSFRGHSFYSERNVLISTIQKARSQAISNMCFGGGCVDGKPHGVHIESTQYTVFQGSSWAGRDSAIDEVVSITSKSVTASGFVDVIFEQLTGEATFSPSSSHDIVLTDSAGKDSSTITITQAGRICIDDPSC